MSGIYKIIYYCKQRFGSKIKNTLYFVTLHTLMPSCQSQSLLGPEHVADEPVGGQSCCVLHGRLKDRNNRIFVVRHNEDAAKLVEQRLELRSSHVLIVHDFFQVVMSPKIVQQPKKQFDIR